MTGMRTDRFALMALARRGAVLAAAVALPACASNERRFSLRAPLWQDTDLRSVRLPCRSDPTKKDPAHILRPRGVRCRLRLGRRRQHDSSTALGRLRRRPRR